MKTYKIAAMVTHSGKHLETEIEAFSLASALIKFDMWLLPQGLSMEAIDELDVSEVVQ